MSLAPYSPLVYPYGMMNLIEKYCRITDALLVTPDLPIEDIVRMIEILQGQLSTYSKQNAALVKVLKEVYDDIGRDPDIYWKGDLLEQIEIALALVEGDK